MHIVHTECAVRQRRVYRWRKKNFTLFNPVIFHTRILVTASVELFFFLLEPLFGHTFICLFDVLFDYFLFIFFYLNLLCRRANHVPCCEVCCILLFGKENRKKVFVSIFLRAKFRHSIANIKEISENGDKTGSWQKIIKESTNFESWICYPESCRYRILRCNGICDWIDVAGG